MLLSLKVEEGQEPKIGGGLRNGKRQGNVLVWSLQRECRAAEALVLGFLTSTLVDNKLAVFEAATSVVIGYNSNKDLMPLWHAHDLIFLFKIRKGAKN